MSTKEQKRQSLALANKVRYERAAIKRDLYDAPPRESLNKLVNLIDTDTLPPAVERMKLSTALDACRNIGKYRVNRIMANLRNATGGTVNEQRPLGDLTPRERQCLIGVLRSFKIGAL